MPEYDSLGDTAAELRERWYTFVHGTPDVEELVSLRRIVQTGLPVGEPA